MKHVPGETGEWLHLGGKPELQSTEGPLRERRSVGKDFAKRRLGVGLSKPFSLIKIRASWQAKGGGKRSRDQISRVKTLGKWP